MTRLSRQVRWRWLVLLAAAFAKAALFHETYPSSTETLTDCLVYRFDKDATLALLLAERALGLV